MSRGIIGGLLLSALISAGVNAQDSVQHAFCRDPHPAPACRSYLLFEYMGALRVAGTEVDRLGDDRDALRSWFAWDIGAMRNRSPSVSLGASLGIGGSADGVRVAVRARRRQWLGHDMVFDLGAGPLMTNLQQGGSAGETPTWGATGDAGIGRARVGLVTLGADVARQRGRTQLATHVGARTESRGAVVVSVIAVIGGLLVLSSLGSADHVY